MLQQQQSRFKDAPWFPKANETVMIGGAGGIGSWLSNFLARAGFKPIVYDFDYIEEHNIGGQLYRAKDINKPKVEALFEVVRELSSEEISIVNERITINSPTHHFMFSAFDNMQARKDLFEVWKKSIPGSLVTPIFIDGRLEMEQLQIFCVTPDRINEYERTLFDDGEVDDAPCTMKQTSHTAGLIGAMMTTLFTNHMVNIYEREKVREVPFYYEFFSPIVLTENVYRDA